MTGDLSKSHWVFAHGSLMFGPGFQPQLTLVGRAWGWERRFGQPSIRNWGTAEAPAPTCSLSPGTHCDGLLLALPHGDGGTVFQSIVRREANDPVSVTVSTEFGDVPAFTWLMSSSWANLEVDQLVSHGVANVRDGGGPSGDAWDYATGVEAALSRHGLTDPLVSSYARALHSAVVRATTSGLAALE
jgi:cation transport protein ChaC